MSPALRLLAAWAVGALSFLPACSSAPRSPSASTVGNCTSGVLFLTPASVHAGEEVSATAAVHCNPGTYPVKLSVVGQSGTVWNLGSLVAAPDGSLKGTLHVPATTPPGFARAFVVALFTCTHGDPNCSPGTSGTVTVLPASK